MERPEFVTEDMVLFVNTIDPQRRSNMFLTLPMLMEMFPWLNGHDAQQVLQYCLQGATASMALAEI